MQHLRVAVCDDAPEDAALLKGLIEETSGGGATVFVFHSGDAFLQTFAQGRYHLLFLDIFIGARLGTEIAAKVREQDSDVLIAFSSISEDFTKESYRLGAYGYLLKPPKADSVGEMVALARLKFGRQARHILLTESGTVELAPDDILYAEANGYSSVLHTQDGPFQTRYTIDALERLLSGPQFLRCHRSYLVNLSRVARIENDFIMQGGGVAYIRVKDYRKMRAAYERYLFDAVRDEGAP